jgi:ribosomal protein S18 acetylase RimI-like enzyme
VHNDYQRRGAAKVLLKDFENDCKSKGIKKLSLDVNFCNEKAINLYRKCGFTVTNPKMSIYTMVKSLK